MFDHFTPALQTNWTYNKKYRVTFDRSYEWIDSVNPCTVVVPQAAGIAVDLIEAEVFKRILAFNNTHGVDEGIYEDGAFVKGKFYLFTATSHALAVYLCLRNGTRTMDRYIPP